MKLKNSIIPKYQIGNKIVSYSNLKGEIIVIIYNEHIKEWLYYTKDEIMVVKESNIKTINNKGKQNRFLLKTNDSNNLP